MNKTQRGRLIRVGIGLLILLALWIYRENQRPEQLVYYSGTTMGPIVYNIKYLDHQNRNFKIATDSILRAFNKSLSTYDPTSEISQFNRGTSIIFSSPFFYPVLVKSKEVNEHTGGAFDPTVGPLVNGWGFGPDKNQSPLDSAVVDSLLRLVGLNQIAFDEKQATKQSPHIILDFSAIAKGYAVDVVAELLEGQGIENYMVEIGGEVRCRGTNQNNKVWRIGIDDPEVSLTERQIKSSVGVKDKSVATSGNYRNFYEVDGIKYAHTISPFTGFPVQHSLLSASVFADDCMTADAYATGFMVTGLDEALKIVEAVDELEGYFIYSDAEGNIKTLATAGISEWVKE